MTLNCELCQSDFSVLSSRLIIKLTKICFLCTYINQMIIEQGLMCCFEFIYAIFWSLGLLPWFSAYKLWVKWVCIHPGNNPGHIRQTHSRFPNICGCLTLNKMHIKYTSLAVCLINNNLNKTSSTPPSEGEKTGLYIPYLIILCTSAETSIY